MSHLQVTMKFTLSTLALSISMSSIALESTPMTEVELAPIKVTATRTDTDWLHTPTSVYTQEVKESPNNMNVNLSEKLQGIPGLQVNNRENYAQDLQISARGFGARSTFGIRGIRLYVDGIPATMPDGQGQTSNIDLNSLERIEVLTGPFSSLYGNSSGGTILTTTREGHGPDTLQLGFSTGSHNKQLTTLQVQGGAEKANEPAYVISSSYFKTDGFREHSNAHKALTNAKLTWNLDDDSQVNWILNRVTIGASDPAGLTRTEWQNNPTQQASFLKQFNVRKTIEQTQTGMTWTKPINDQHEFYGMWYLGNRQVQQYQSIPKSAQVNPRHAGGIIDFDRDYYGADLRWTGRDLLENTTFIAGVALDQMRENRQGYENFDAQGQYGVKGKLRRDETNTLWNIDPYVQASWQFLANWQIDTGLRYSNVHYQSKDHYITEGNGDDSGKTSYQKLLPSLALGWTIIPEIYSYISYSKGFETPTFTEMAYPTLATSGINFSLKPATSDTYEIGLKSENLWGVMSLAVFSTKTKNDIVSSDSNGGRNTFRNAKQTLRQGAEVSWQKKVWENLNAQVSYSYLDATFDADIPATQTKPLIAKGTYIPGIAKNQAFASLAWQQVDGFQAGIDLRYMDKVFVNDANSDAAPSYFVTGAYLGYIWQKNNWTMNTFARIDNLFDRQYIGSIIVNDGNSRFFEPADGRNFSAGLSIKTTF